MSHRPYPEAARAAAQPVMAFRAPVGGAVCWG